MSQFEDNNQQSQQATTRTLTYAEELWDQANLLEATSRCRSQRLYFLKDFLWSFREILDTFAKDLNKATERLRFDLLPANCQETEKLSLKNLSEGVDEFAAEMLQLSQSIQQVAENTVAKDITEKCQANQKGYSDSNRDLLKTCDQIWFKLHMSRQQMTLKKEEYQNNMFELEQLYIGMQREPQLKLLESFTTKLSEQEQLTVDSEQSYEKAVQENNEAVDELNGTYKKNLNKCQQNDTQVSGFIKYSLAKVSGVMQQIGNSIVSQSQKFSASVNKIDVQADIDLFIKKHQSDTPIFEKQVFADYQSQYVSRQKNAEIRQKIKEQEKDIAFILKKQVQSMGGQKVQLTESQLELNRQEILSCVRGIVMEGKPIKNEQQLKLKKLLQTNESREALAEALLENGCQNRQVKSVECFKSLADIIRFVLTITDFEENMDPKLLYLIMQTACNLYTMQTQVRRKSYLYSLISDHNIFKRIDLWRVTLHQQVKLKIELANERRKRRLEMEQQQREASSFSKFKQLAQAKVKNLTQSKEEKAKEELDNNSNLVFDCLSQFINFFINFGMQFGQANSLLSEACESYVTDEAKAHSLYTELRSSQRNPDTMYSVEERRIITMQKRSKRMVQFGSNDLTLVIGCCIKFVNEDTTIRNLLCANKDIHDILKPELLKQALLRADQDRLKVKRAALWTKLLKIDEQKYKFDFIENMDRSHRELPKQVQEQIQVDINRSFKQMKDEISHQNLQNILFTYAVVNQHLDYCQGMNFIAGFLYLSTRDEGLSFQIMREVINKYDMAELFDTSTPSLKRKFYQLDRLISICLPDLHAHFKEENVNASFFSTTFFITLYTQVLQSQANPNNMWKLERIWDYIIIYGWKAIFKVAIVLLKDSEEQLLEMNFERILGQIMTMPIKFIFGEEESEMNHWRFNKQMRDIEIRSYLITRLQREFEDSIKMHK